MTQLHSSICSIRTVLIIVHIRVLLNIILHISTPWLFSKKLSQDQLYIILLRPVCNYNAEHGYFVILTILDKIKAQNASNGKY